MAHSDKLPENVLEAIASQIGEAAPVAFEADVFQQSLELAESFAVWSLSADAVMQTQTNLSDLALPTGRWHHQIKANDQAEYFARSVALGAEDNWSVRELFMSELAQKIQEAIGWIDIHVQQDPLVRLLVIPIYHVHAFWLAGDTNQVLVIDMPQDFSYLEYEVIYSAEEFLENLSKEQPAIGIIL